ncbi:hypothetical protein [Microbacterium sp. Leaf161]|uniref:hypothetical protein n=1 Tax=Microbacterium sp. Leaf161 TaxID=1736281 RepID=UPI000ACF8748|nr:hypothetical protein [Microbacterium sp. Leaf161]
MRDIDTAGDHIGDIYVAEGRHAILHAEASDDLLEAEVVRLGGSLRLIRLRRYGALSVGYGFAFVAVGGGLYLMNSADSWGVGVIVVVAGVLTRHIALQMWDDPNDEEESLESQMDTIREIRHYRRKFARSPR